MFGFGTQERIPTWRCRSGRHRHRGDGGEIEVMKLMGVKLSQTISGLKRKWMEMVS